MNNLSCARVMIKGIDVLYPRCRVQLSLISRCGWSKMDFLMDWWFAVLIIVIVLLAWDAIDKSGRPYRAMNKFPGPRVFPLIGTLSEILFKDQGKVRKVCGYNQRSHIGL